MDQKRIDEVMAGDVARKLLQRTIARLAYVARDGTPRVVPIGYLWDGSAIVMCTATNASKIKALQVNPDVALTIDTDEFPPNVLLVRGKAELELVEGIPDEYMQMNDPSYMTPEQREAWEAGVRSLYDAMYRIRVVPRWAKVLDFETTLPSAVEELIARRDANS
jgi:nitroimidazol reductase NimA-like FMN-containing flavoprotein (pyridoxamine 5'-phosphate oxidase superfamily)